MHQKLGHTSLRKMCGKTARLRLCARDSSVVGLACAQLGSSSTAPIEVWTSYTTSQLEPTVLAGGKQIADLTFEPTDFQLEAGYRAVPCALA